MQGINHEGKLPAPACHEQSGNGFNDQETAHTEIS